MALWSVKLADEARAGLTIYQVQELIRSGQVKAEAEVSDDGSTWKRVADVPSLARALPDELSKAATEAESRTVQVHGLLLEKGPDGKVLPPPPEVIARLLGGEGNSREVRTAATKRFNRAMLIGLSITILILLVVLARQAMMARSMLR